MQTQIERLALSYLPLLINAIPNEGWRLKKTVDMLMKGGHKSSNACCDDDLITIFTEVKNRLSKNTSKSIPDVLIFIELCSDFLDMASRIKATASKVKEAQAIVSDEKLNVIDNINAAKEFNKVNIFVSQPEEILIHTFGFLYKNSIKSVALTCSRFASIIKNKKIMANTPILLDIKNPEITVIKGELPRFKYTLTPSFTFKDQYIALAPDSMNVPIIISVNKKDASTSVRYRGHTGEINCAIKVSDEHFISGSKDKTICIWPLFDLSKLPIDDTVSPILRLQGHEKSVCCLSILSTGHILSGSNDKTIRIWDIKTQQCLKILSGHAKGITHVAELSPGKIISVAKDNTIRIWDIKKETCELILEDQKDITSIITLSVNTFAASFADKRICIWNHKGDFLKELTAKDEPVRHLARFNPTTLVGRSLKTVFIWDLNTYRRLHSMKCDQLITYVECSSDQITVLDYCWNKHFIKYKPANEKTFIEADIEEKSLSL